MPAATRQYQSSPGESWMNSWMFPQSPPPMQQQPPRFNPAALQVTTVRGPGIQPGIQTSPPNPLAMVVGASPSPSDQPNAAGINPLTGMFNAAPAGMNPRDVLNQRAQAIRATMPQLQPQQQMNANPLAMVGGQDDSGVQGRGALASFAGPMQTGPRVGTAGLGPYTPEQPHRLYGNPMQTPLRTIGYNRELNPSPSEYTTEAGRLALRSRNLRADPTYQLAVENNRNAITDGQTTPVALRIAGAQNPTELSDRQQANRNSRQEELAQRQQYSRARGMGVNPMALAMQDRVQQGGQLTPEQMLAMQGASPETIAAYMGKQAESSAMQKGYEEAGKAGLYNAIAGGLAGNADVSALLKLLPQGQDQDAAAIPNAAGQENPLFAGLTGQQLTTAQQLMNSGDAMGMRNFLVTQTRVPDAQKNAILQTMTGKQNANIESPTGEWFPLFNNTLRELGLMEPFAGWK